MKRAAALTLTTIALGAGLAACGGAGEAGDTCAGIDAGLISAIAGDDFSARESGAFPPAENGAPYECRVDADDQSVIDIDAGLADSTRQREPEAATYWAFNGGEGYVTEEMATWSCDDLMISVSMPSSQAGTRAQTVGLLAALADQIDCPAADE